MVIEVGGVKALLGGAWNVPAKPCDSCKSGTAAVFCRADSAFLCLGCNAKIHCANKLASRHERVWMCEVCEQAPAAVTCKADAAALCVTCDADIHSANPLAQRHERVPVEPFFDSDDSIVKSSSSPFNLHVVPNCSDDVDTASLLIPNPNVNSKLVDTFDMNSGAILFPEMDDPFLDFEYPKSVDSRFHHHSAGTDSVVPVQAKPLAAPVINHHSSEINCFDMDFCRSKLSNYSYPAQSISQSVSSSSPDVGVVPDGNCNSMSDTSYPFGRNISFEPSGVVDIVPSAATTTSAAAAAQPTQLSGMDREARVMRYREKRKNRKFEKTIRYASRKAYAETRPRIKGRFAKRTETGADADGLYGSSAVSEAYMGMGDYQYGVVPTF